MLLAIDCRWYFFRKVAIKNVRLPHLRPHASHLQYRSWHHLRVRFRLSREWAAGFFCQVKNNGAGLEHRESTGVAIADGGNFAIWANLQKSPGFLVVGTEVQGNDLVTPLDLPGHCLLRQLLLGDLGLGCDARRALAGFTHLNELALAR